MGFLQSLECLCIKAGSGSITAQGSVINSKISCEPAVLKATIVAASQIVAPVVRARSSKININVENKIDAKLSAEPANLATLLLPKAEVYEKLTIDYVLKKTLENTVDINSKFLDKFAGEFRDLECVQKIYPIADISNGPGVFVGPNLEFNNLYSFIDEGIFTGDYDKPFGDSQLISDDNQSYIQPSSVATNASFKVKFGVTSPLVIPRDTSIRFRAAAPIKNYESLIPPQYTIKDIKFEDPSGNLIAWYNDIVFRGDADLYAANPKNYTTYSSFPKINNAALYEWENEFPLLRDPGQYTLSFSVDVQGLDDPFDDGYSTGFAESSTIPPSAYPYYAQPTKNLRISAIEICASGGFGPAPENYIPIYTEVEATGHRIERRIFPAFMPVFDFDTGIYPSGLETRWELNSDTSYKNTSALGSVKLIETLNQNQILDYIKLNTTTPVNDSGKLLLKFSHSPVGIVDEVTKGSFNCAFDESICGMWIVPSGAFNTLNKDPFETTDHFFVVDTVSLRVLAKKAPGSRDYIFDVVGYSDDKILNVTSAVGGFLQNIEGAGNPYLPLSSGFNPVDDLGIGGETLSDRDQYFEASGTNNAGGDHYLLATRPVVNSTEWRWYEIPLKIYKDKVELGESEDYRMSSYFENLFLDIFPLPTGAAIAKIELLVRYAPQNALMLATQGGEMIASIQDGRSEGSLYPVVRQSNDDIINAAYEPISKIENIPHAFATPSSIKSNYSRRWRGMEGTVQGAFDVDMFDFGYNNPLLDFPFLSGYYDFDYDVGNTVVPRVGPVSGTITSIYSPYKYKNLGWRFTNGSLFASQLPGYTGDYLTTDWTSLSNGPTNFELHPLYGKIADAFNNVVRLSGQNSNINFGNHNFASGFSIFVRFSPDANYANLFDSGVLVSKWDAGKNLEFALGYSGGYLRGIARSAAGTVYSVQDSKIYSDYQYPLNVIFTYNDHGSSGLKLYTDNEFENNWTTLRASSVVPFELSAGTSNLVVGWSSGSGIGANVFVSELGFSTNNIVYSNSDATLKEVTAQKFLENSRMKWWKGSDLYSDDSFKLWSYVDENTYSDWKIGDFKYCMFAPAFDQMQKRTGRDLISFNIVHDGLAYSQRVNMPMPSSVSSGIAYHTQIENDFLRMHLSDTADNFYSTYHRITKTLPRGYKFSDKALVVETVLEHQTNDQIVWPEGQIGPKLIVSLYTKRQEPYWTPDENNWGLINRSIHYIEPSSCFMRVNSTFTYDSLIDESEEWALFPREPRLKEFEEKYFSQDVDDMFLQYDIVYPSGTAFKSRIDIHSAHVRLEDAYVLATPNSGVLNVTTSGGYPVQEYINLMLEARQYASGDVFNLYTIGPILIENSGLPIYTSGGLIAPASLDLYTTGLSGILNNVNLYTSGSPVLPIYQTSGGLNFHMFGRGVITSQAGNNLGLALTSYNNQVANIPDPNVVNLFTFGSSGVIGAIETSMPMFVLNEFENYDPVNSSGKLNLTMIGSSALFNRYPNGSMNLIVYNSETGIFRKRLNLTLYNEPEIASTIRGRVNMFIGTADFHWFNFNYGQDIDVQDNSYASLAADDEIRGVDLIGYGSCDGDSPKKAIDPPIITHDTVWREATCNEGGIFRAINTYTNLEAGYSGNYYGIRKFSGLLPNTAYKVQMNVKTGTTDSIELPREWEEFEYGSNDTINFSGVKLIGDAPYVDSGRAAEDKYGTSVAIKKDLIAVGSPYREILDETGSPINKAGSVFLYRRDEDLAGLKAGWQLEDVLMLPSGYRRDYIQEVIEKLFCYPNNTLPEFCISGQKWNIGQEGREFGFSLDIANSGNRQVVAVGAPGASWNRTFDTIETSGIPVCMIVFTDKFSYSEQKLSEINDVARKWDVLYKYFSAPWQQGFQPQIEIKLLVYQLAFAEQQKPLVSSSKNWFYHKYLPRLDDQELIDEIGKDAIYDTMRSGIKNLFLEAFPHINSVHSGIPPIIGLFKDNTPSTFAAFNYNGIDVTSDFVDYYKSYSYQSGVFDQNANSSASGYVNQKLGRSEQWYNDAKIIMDDTLATGNLITNDALKFITSGVGQEWANENAYEFQIPPASGGRVYIFERENGTFNLVQEIKSPFEEYSRTYSNEPNDRFGHSVSISDNGEVIAIGSPYSTSACSIFERDESENTRLLNNLRAWLVSKGYSNEVSYYDYLAVVSGVNIAKQATYYSLSQSDKFAVRLDNNINLYKKIYDYSYGDIAYTGTWKFIVDEYAGTSRLGFSSAINEHGDIVAFGAPTDSFNEFDDTNVWYRGEDTWASYTNAGAVRLFESRKYFPHNKAVEFYKFGNLDRNAHPDLAASGYYDELETIFNSEGIDFEKTKFSELEIPKDAGLAFIITPEVDAASDEIIQNIKDWLSLGDRTLVLVGNDPLWEDNGLYRKSNDILNKILQKLNSRMRLYPARDRYESLNEDISQEDILQQKYNVTNAFIPEYAHTSYIPGTNIFAKGVADIKIDVSSLGLSNVNIHAPCDEINTECEMPIKNIGDMRAQWQVECISKNDRVVRYKENWPFHFGNPNPSRNCADWPESPSPLINRPYEEPVAVLTAAEWLPPYTYTIPASSGVNINRTPIYETITINNPYLKFSDNHINGTEFILIDDSNSNSSGNFISYNEGQFIDPPLENGRDAILQATGIPYQFQAIEKDRQVNSGVYNNESILMIEEMYENTSSSCILMASLLAENDVNLGYSLSIQNNNNDENILFFNNLLMKNCNEVGNIYQLGDWTGRNSWANAYAGSKLTTLLDAWGHTYLQNVSSSSIPSYVNVVWVANPLNKPSDIQINYLKNWMQTGNKKLIITYSNDQIIADNVFYICEKLGIDSKPWYSNSESKFLKQVSSSVNNGNDENSTIQKLDNSHISIGGCLDGYGWISYESNTIVNNVSLKLSQQNYEDDANTQIYIPIKPSLVKQTKKIIYYADQIREKYWETPIGWKMFANANVTFPVIENSGYRVFIDWISEYNNENQEVTLLTSDVVINPNFPDNKSPQYKLLPRTSLGLFNRSSVDLQIPSGIDELTINFSIDKLFQTIISDGSLPKTPRILSISGCLLPIETAYSTVNQQVIVGYEETEIPWYNPEQTVTIPPQFRPIKTDSRKYCADLTDCPGKEIEDGPVIVAEEFENFSQFNNGQNRSRIVVISDSTILQGKNPHYRTGFDSPNQRFIRSLYPSSPAVNNTGRNFEFVQKIVAPERGSPAKYFAVANSNVAIPQLLVDKFGLNGVDGNLSNYTDQENNFDPRSLIREADPISGEDIENEIENFAENVFPTYGVFPRFSGEIDGTTYLDAKIGGGIPQLMIDFGKDYIDLDAYPSGYRGDLFGYSLAIHGDKLIIGAPFHAFDTENLISWADVIASGFLIKTAGQGGAGAVFYYEKTGQGKNVISDTLPWEFKQKIKPNSLNIGIDNADTGYLFDLMGTGVQFLDSNFILENASIGDQFGYDVAIDADFMVVGAPGHDFETLHEHIYSGSAAFIRKEFTRAFDIPLHNFYDMGSSGVRIDQYGNNSGVAVLNNGAVFAFEHRIQDWRTREKKWEFAEKLVAQGYNARNQETSVEDMVAGSGCENDFFGRTVDINRARRGDGDYTMIIGSPRHSFATSGVHITGKLSNAGASYIYDAMLREQEPKIPSEENWIKAQLFGDNDPLNNLSITVYQNKTGNQISYSVTGIVNTNANGNIFLEASGFDPSNRGFIAHRPYVEYVIGNSISGIPTNGAMPMFIVTDPVKNSGNINFYISGPDSSFVYNNMNLLLKAWNSGENSLNFNTIGTSGIYLDQSLILFMESGIGLSQSDLNLRIRGK